MNAWQLHELGEPADVLRWEEVADPRSGNDAAVISVEAVALNFPDVLLCRGQYQERPPLPFTPGLEIAGRVIDPGGTGLPEGKRVLASPGLPHGGLAERVSAPRAAMFPLPKEIPAEDAAAMLITYQTGWVGLHRRAQLQTGEVLLVHAGAGGVGSAAIQLGLAAGARVIATAGGPEKVAVCRDLGADVVVDYLSEDFVAAVKEATDGRGADVIYDSVGGEVFDRSRKCIAFEGRIVVVGFAGGTIPTVATNHLLVKNYSVVGLHWGLYRLMEPELLPRVHEELVRLYLAGAIRPLTEVVPLSAAPAALTRLASRQTIGKVVCTL